MSALSSHNVTFLTPHLKEETVRFLVAQIVWQLFDKLKDNSIKVTLLKIPISIKISKLEPLIKAMVGPRLP
jgi:hypothetical protein